MTRRALVDALAARARDADPPALDAASAEQLVDGALGAAADRDVLAVRRDAIVADRNAARSAERSADRSADRSANQSAAVGHRDPHRAPVAAIAARAQLAEPPPLDDLAARRIVERALRVRRVPSAPRAVPARVWIAATLAAGCAAALAVGWMRPADPSRGTVELSLPTGDRVIGAAQLEIEQLALADRRVRLARGTAVFDVARAVRGQRFAVATAHLVATAKGTVFAVATDAAHTRVDVFEGRVEVQQDGVPHLLLAGQAWDSASHVALAAERPRDLADAIASAIARHDGMTTDVVAAAPSPATSSPATSSPATSSPGTSSPTSSSPAPPASPSSPPSSPPPSSSSPSPKVAVPSKITETSAPPASPDAPATLDELYARAQRQLAHLEYSAALATADLAKSRGAKGPAWLLVVADASRALGKLTDAADAYDAAARGARGADAVEAGYSAAYLRFHDLHDPGAALASLDAAHVDAAGSHLEERGLALHVQILDALGKRTEAQPLAQRYLARFPRRDAAERLRKY